ncbi:MAG: NPCBM/NEW2 domain-containing protein, partial [Armatimonadetes bacterium]|nr:NPCBM/NEW2 domain-containing protein [Armatimonadota bacterium]
DGSPQEFTASFEVRADGNTLFEGRPKRAGDVPDQVNLDVTGVLQLELIVRGKDPLHTRELSVVWGDPSVDQRPAAAPPSPAPPAGPQPTSPPAPPASPQPPTPTPGAWHPGGPVRSGTTGMISRGDTSP